jgi:hypothetical protein
MADKAFTSSERLYLDKDGNVVGADDPNRASLLVAAGGTMSAEDAAKYGLNEEGRRSAQPRQAEKRVRQPGPEDPEVAEDMKDGSADETTDTGNGPRQGGDAATRGEKAVGKAPANKAQSAKDSK